MRCSSRRAALLGCAVSVFLAPAFDAGAQTPGVYVFGDSAVEQGNRYAIPGAAQPPSPPYYSVGGFISDSNGPVWLQQAYPGSRPVLAGAPFGNRLNFAISGARTGLGVDFEGGVDTGVLAQIDRFAALKAGGTIKIRPDDLFFIDAGPNDVFQAILDGADLTAAGRQGGVNLALAAQDLSALGARYVFVNDFADAGLAPILRYADPSIGVAASDASRAGSAALRDAVRAALPSLPAGAQIIVVNSRELVSQVIANPARFGFTNVVDACFDDVLETLCAPNAAGQNKYLFFDNAGHPTEAGQALLARFYVATVESVTGQRHAEFAGVARALSTPLDAAQSVADARRAAFLGSVQRGWSAYAFGGASNREQDAQGRQADASGALPVAGLGFERATDHWLVGGEAVHTSGDIESGKLAGDSRIGLLALYVVWRGESLYAAATLRAGGGGIEDLQRDIAIPTFTATSNPDFLVGGFEAEVGLRRAYGPIAYTLGVALRADRLESADQFRETGAPGLELSVSEIALTHTLAELRGSAEWRRPREHGVLVAGASSGVGYLLENDTDVATQLLGTTARPVRMRFETESDIEARVSPYIRYEFAGGAALELRYSGRYADENIQHTALVTISKRF